MQIKQQITINTSADKVWEILGPQYANVFEWVSAVNYSQGRNNSPVPLSAPCSGRVCETELGPFEETITHYDERNMSLAYSAQGEKMPFFVKQLSNSWKVIPLGTDRTKVTMCAEISIMPVFRLVMGPMMRLQMGGILKNAVEELKYYAENGVPHPRKVDAQQKYQLKAA